MNLKNKILAGGSCSLEFKLVPNEDRLLYENKGPIVLL